MPAIVSLEDTKALLIITWVDDDARLNLLIEAASVAIERHLKSRAAEFIDYDKLAESPPDYTGVNPLVRVATVFLVGILYRDPDGTDTQTFYENGFLPKQITALLYTMRKPALA